ncbi:hypothetical protein ABER23_25460 [Paenibacillus lautus]|uniref:hypothetical protein n=1 Tax=Paenibacillus lautus TaxID=1401 RepID=UPI003D2D674C
MEIGTKVYYDKNTGLEIQTIWENSGTVSETTKEQDFASYSALAERVPETVGIVQFEVGEYRKDFQAGGRITKIDLVTLKPLFTYPDPTDPETPQEPQLALSEQVTSLKTENESLKNRVSDVEMTLTEILFS